MKEKSLVKIINVIRNDNFSNNDLYSLISYLFRIYIDRITKDNILKYIDNGNSKTKTK